MKKPKMLSFLEKELPIERVARGARRVGGENLFFAQKFTSDQKCSNFFKFVLEVSHLEPFSLKEASAKMWRGRGPKEQNTGPT